MSERTRRYAAYGLTIDSNQPLPGAPASAAATADLAIDFRTEAPPEEIPDPVLPADGVGDGWYAIDTLPGGGRLYRLGADDGARTWSMEVSGDGARMIVRRTEATGIDDVVTFVMTRGLGACLAAMARPVMHACAIDAGGEAIVVTGESGAGKSTLAATALRGGLRLLADDIAALSTRDGRVHVARGVRRMRLEPATARAVGRDPGQLERVFVDPGFADKRWVELRESDEATDGALPLAAVHVLGPRRAGPPLVERLAPAEALPLLLTGGYGADLLDPGARAALLPFWARLAQEVPVTRVHASDDLAALPALLETLTGAR